MAMKLLMKLRVREVHEETNRVRSFTLVHHKRPTLPPFDAGSHVTVLLPNGMLRPYSLCSDPADLGSYRLAVQREDGGLGGSRAMHAVRPGDTLFVRYPANHFRLADGAGLHLLIAGGIGITPILAMARSLKARQENFRIHYCAPQRRDMAFVDEVLSFCSTDEIRLHTSREPGTLGRLDVAALVDSLRGDAHVYCCGPKRLVDAVTDACHRSDRPDESLHVERFAGLPAELRRQGDAFRIQLASSGRILDVPEDKSTLDVLRESGIAVESSCEGGVCRTCRIEFVAGEPIHRDMTLGPDERARYLLACVSRAKGTLVLAL